MRGWWPRSVEASGVEDPPLDHQTVRDDRSPSCWSGKRRYRALRATVHLHDSAGTTPSEVEHVAIVREGREEASPCLQACRLAGERVASGVNEPMVVSQEPSQPRKIAAVDRGVEGQDDRLIG
jgi:hypothetical protein